MQHFEFQNIGLLQLCCLVKIERSWDQQTTVGAIGTSIEHANPLSWHLVEHSLTFLHDPAFGTHVNELLTTKTALHPLSSWSNSCTAFYCCSTFICAFWEHQGEQSQCKEKKRLSGIIMASCYDSWKTTIWVVGLAQSSQILQVSWFHGVVHSLPSVALQPVVCPTMEFEA
jgi:hypothetical protein